MPRAILPSGRKLLLLLVLAATFIGGAWRWAGPPRDPEHDGFRLSALAIVDSQNEDIREPYAKMLRAFGPDAVIWLAYQVEHGKVPFNKQGSLPLDRSPLWLRQLFPEKWGGLRHSATTDERLNAVRGLELLGRDAEPALPVLIRVLGNSGDSQLDRAVAIALHHIEPTPGQILDKLFDQGNAATRLALISTIEMRVGTVTNPAPEADMAFVKKEILKTINDPAPPVRCEAAIALRRCYRLRPDRPLIDSEIASRLHIMQQDANPQYRIFAAQALQAFGLNPKPAATGTAK